MDAKDYLDQLRKKLDAAEDEILAANTCLEALERILAKPEAVRRRKWSRWVGYAVAADIAAVIVLSTLLYWWQSSPSYPANGPPQPPPPPEAIYELPNGDQIQD